MWKVWNYLKSGSEYRTLKNINVYFINDPIRPILVKCYNNTWMSTLWKNVNKTLDFYFAVYFEKCNAPMHQFTITSIFGRSASCYIEFSLKAEYFIVHNTSYLNLKYRPFYKKEDICNFKYNFYFAVYFIQYTLRNLTS